MLIFFISEGEDGDGGDDDDDDFWIETMKSSFKFQIKSTAKIKNSSKFGIKPKKFKNRCKNYLKVY